MEKTYNKLVNGIKQYFKKAKFKKAVFGLSGGLDSSVVAKLLVDALGSKNVYALIMPEEDVTLDENTKDAVNLCRKLKIKYYQIEINDFIKDFERLKQRR